MTGGASEKIRVAIMHLGKIAALGTPQELKKSISKKDATLDDVFIHFAGGDLESEGGYREASRDRRVARRIDLCRQGGFCHWKRFGLESC